MIEIDSETAVEESTEISPAEEKASKTKKKTKTSPPRRSRRTKSSSRKHSKTAKSPQKRTVTEEVRSVQGEVAAEIVEKEYTEKKEKHQGRKISGKVKNKSAANIQKSEGKPNKKSKKDTTQLVKLLINAEEPEECRIAQVEGGRIESFQVTTQSLEQTKNNIYKGRISSVESNLQAAFVDIGLEKNGFLSFSEIHPEYYDVDVDPSTHWKDLHIQEVIRKGQEVLVQVVKEPIGNKGANVTTYLSLPGRCLVLMPGSDSSGVSRKIDDESQRSKLREMMNGFSIPEGIGYIIRTASRDITKTALSNDFRYLLRLWREIKKRGQTKDAPALIYKDQDIIAKFLRDHFSADIKEILVDSQAAYDQVMNFLALLPAKQRKTVVRLHKGPRPIFNQFDVEEQIETIYQPYVKLPSGGSIVINPTEALVAIDVNSGRTGKDKNFSETIFLANKEAAAEMARQLRLRDLGGLIVVDFIDMRNKTHIREVEKQVKASMKRDKAKVDISRISKFGLMQISRQKMGAPTQTGSYNACEHCQGRGVVRSVETQALFYLRRIQTGVSRKKVVSVECRLPMNVARYLLNKKKEELVDLEKRYDVVINIEPAPEMNPSDYRIDFVKH